MSEFMRKALKRDLIIGELRIIAQEHGGILKVKDGIEFAKKNPNSALHQVLTWDNSVAGQKWREHQMRNIIRATIQLVLIGPKQIPYTAPVFWSFMGERNQNGGGYRPLVLSDKKMMKQMLKDALAELQAFENKYKILNELVEAVAAVRQHFGGKKKRPRPFIVPTKPTDRPQPPMHA